MKKSLIALAVAAALAPSFAMAEAGDIVVRLRATHINPDEDSKLGKQTDASYGANTAALLYGKADAELRVDSNTIPELDISYYFTKNIAAELILALGSKHDVKTTGTYDKNLGEINILPPTLTLQWHFNPDQMFDPYVGAGVSYIRAMNNGLNLDGSAAGGGIPVDIKVSRNSWGPAFQAGFDVNLENKWLLNLDVKKIWFDTKVEGRNDAVLAGWQKIDSLDVDPWVVSVGFGKKF